MMDMLANLMGQSQQPQPTLVPMVPATTVSQPNDLVAKLIELFKRKSMGSKRPSPISSPWSNKPMGPIDTKETGAVQDQNKSVNDFTNF